VLNEPRAEYCSDYCRGLRLVDQALLLVDLERWLHGLQEVNDQEADVLEFIVEDWWLWLVFAYGSGVGGWHTYCLRGR
jgi:hypothetical protein